jgi:hypothetical protein
MVVALIHIIIILSEKNTCDGLSSVGSGTYLSPGRLGQALGLHMKEQSRQSKSDLEFENSRTVPSSNPVRVWP